MRFLSSRFPRPAEPDQRVTPYAILTVHERHIKSSLPHKIYPVYALLDGKYLTGAKKEILVNTAVDALGHFIESYVNTNATPFQPYAV